jgi:hypothetical protein
LQVAVFADPDASYCRLLAKENLTAISREWLGKNYEVRWNFAGMKNQQT